MTEALTPASDLPGHLRSLFDKAMSSIKMQNAGYAVQLLLPIIKEVPSFLEGRRALRAAAIQSNGGKKKLIDTTGLALMKIKPKIEKDPVGALYDIEAILAEDPLNVAANQMLFDAANAANMPETAAFGLEVIMKAKPEDTKNMHRLAEFYLAHEDPAKAIQVFNNIIKVNPADGEARKGLTNANARLSMKQQKWGEGDGGNFRELLRNKDKAKQMEDLNRIGATKEQMQEQLALLGEEYAANPNDINVSRRIGDLYERLEDYENALVYFNWAYQLSNGDSSIEARLLKVQERLDEMALARLQAEIDANPEGPEADAKRQELEAMKAARAEKQIAIARDRVERNPTDPQLRFELGTHLLNFGYPTEAIPELQRAKGNPAIRTKAMLALARCYEAKNMFDLADRQLQEAANELTVMDAVKKDVLYTRGVVLEKMGRKEEAMECFKHIYEVDYGYRDVAARVEGSY